MSLKQGMFSSKKQDWRTPADLYLTLHKRYKFTFDPCPEFPKFDGLKRDWGKRNFVNPPYGREIGEWVYKGYIEGLKGKLVVMLLSARTDTKWWHDYVMQAYEIFFIKGRLKFSNSKNSAPFPSAIAIFNDNVLRGYVGSMETTGEIIHRKKLGVELNE